MKKIVLLPVFLLLFSSVVFGQTTEKDAKAIAEKIQLLVQNLEFPAGAGPADGTPVKICIIGASPVTTLLKELAGSSSVLFEVTAVSPSDDLKEYHIVYNSSTEISSLPNVLKQVGGAKILTLSSAKDFARYGVMVNLAKEDSDFKYEINTMVLDGVGIKIDSSILNKAVKI